MFGYMHSIFYAPLSMVCGLRTELHWQSPPGRNSSHTSKATTRPVERPLDRDRNYLLEPDHRRLIIIYSNDPPTRLFEQITKRGDRALFTIKKLIIFGASKKNCPA